MSIALAGGYVYLIIRYIKGWKQMPAWEIPPGFQPATTVSILVPARNEQDNITDCLESLLRQSYPHELFEVIVIDDHSTDATPAAVQRFISPNGKVRLLKLADYVEQGFQRSFKKKAIEVGVSQAQGELIVTTDADCLVQQTWLSLLVSFYVKHRWKFIAAPVNFHREKNLFERFQSLDFMGMMCGTGAGIYLRLKNMCNGANLAYPKVAFLEVNGFEGIDHLATGDDILLQQKIAARHPGRVGFLKNAAATVFSEAKPTVAAFVSQRIRWASKSTAYRERQVTFILGMVFLFCCAIILSLALVPWRGGQALGLFVLLLAVKTITDYFFLGMMAKFFGRQDLMRSYLPSQFLHIAYIVVVGILGNVVRRYEWKGRRVS